MTKFVLAITLAAISGLFIVSHGNEPSLHASAAVTPAAQVDLPALPATDGAADDEMQCDATTMSEDAADCAAGGWHAMLTCCNTSPGPQERWAKGTARKCCGPCFLP